MTTEATIPDEHPTTAEADEGDFQPSAIEREVLVKQHRRTTSKPPRGQVKVSDGAVAMDYHNEIMGTCLLNETFGTADVGFTSMLLTQLAGISDASGAVSQSVLNGHLATIAGIQPSDEVEAMIAAQMAAIHGATMTFAGRLSRCTVADRAESYERSLNRLARTFAAQLEALKRYRAKGEQRVIVEHQHVHIHPGGQAVVGTVNNHPGGGGIEEKWQSTP